MAKIPVNLVLADFHRMLDEHWPYVWGAARTGCVDCSGAFVWSFKQHGGSIYHGSNSIARKYITGPLLPISEARPGYAAFKKRAWTSSQEGNSWFGQAPGDIYHIGLVDETGRGVLNAKGTKSGFCLDPIDTWAYVAPLKDIDYTAAEPQKEDPVMAGEHALVTGGALFLREKPSKNATTIARMENGTEVLILEDHGDWVKARPLGKTGYCMKKYLDVD